MADEKEPEGSIHSGQKADINGDVVAAKGRVIHTSGGAYIEGTVNTGGGDFIGRDKIINNIYNYPPILKAPLREVFKPLIENRAELFGGREAALNHLGHFIKEPQGGYLIATAPAGFGKTALMANMISLESEAFAYHFFTPLYGTDSLTELFFLENIVEQIAQWHDHQQEIPKDLNKLRSLYHHFISEPLAQTRILVLDGLDEVTGWKLAPYLSRSLPDNLHVILTVRDVGQNWQQEYALPPGQTQELRLDGLDRAGVAEVLRAAGDKAAVFADQPALLDEIMRVSTYEVDISLGADPFYIRLLAEDVAAGELTPDNISNRPQGLNDYLDVWWKRIREQAGDQPTRDLFGSLTVTLGPIGREELEAFNPSLVDDWTRDYFDEILDKVQRWVVGDLNQGYALAHPRLRHYMQTRLKTESYLGKLLAYCADWPHNHSPYVVTHYIDHLKMAGYPQELYNTILDQKFRETQQIILGDTSSTLDNLRTALTLALQNDKIAIALSCISAYRHITRTTSIAQAILDAVDDKNFEKALELLAWKSHVPDWGYAFYLYVAWEAALEQEEELSNRAVRAAARLSVEQSDELGKALLVRTAYALAGNQQDAVRTRLATMVQSNTVDNLLESFPLARPISDVVAAQLLSQIEPQLQYLEAATAGGQAEGISSVMFLETEAEESPYRARDLRATLQKLAPHPAGRKTIERVVDAVLTNPYPRYRDIALVTLAGVTATVADDSWVRGTLRRIIMTGLDLEGVTFTFDLPLMLLEEAEKRALPEAQLLNLPEHRERALASPDRWGTIMRAHSARAATLFRQGAEDQAFEALEAAALGPAGFAGYAALHYLSLANRCFEFGRPSRITESIAAWRPESQMDAALEHANLVRDEAFRLDRVLLVETYRSWANQETPNVKTGLTNLAQMPDYATRLAYIDHLSARWSWPINDPNWQGLKDLVPQALTDGTTLDAVLGRLFGLYLTNGHVQPLSNDDLVKAIDACSPNLMDGQPWNLAQWR